MTRAGNVYQAMLAGAVPSFREFQAVVTAYGFELKRVSGSHHIYRHPQLRSSLNIQPQGRDAKPYQVRQFLAMVADNGLTMGDAR